MTDSAIAAHYVRLFATSDGESHFESLSTPLVASNYAPPAPPLHLSTPWPATGFAFLGAPEGWFGDWHPSPRRQVFAFLIGEFSLEASDGERRDFGPGDCLLMDDTSGKGHATTRLGAGPSLIAVTQLGS